ncbi:glutamate--tRNA ligase [Coxiella endosymbiont of Amblyomma sculptum]|uniref:glutamate--tRNA ligase n=1 Tax=Coxiella endosymbiont of Amblyomma sculptum TaxID=2487929 RepID=UPI00132EF214|nr:glutamate--tRNA ligase [Coxiella endosymbiont of Amblyomma sculptum]QHG92299.1 glutamate--tRNA ligase [Coxiella endosymbiont of Amblyomma sculptum]
MVKSRFCPSPTGLMHLGNIRTALFNFLLAKSKKGVFLLRIEDTDIERSRDTFRKSLQEDLYWMGLKWQEGPDKDGGNGPYCQSERQLLYNSYYQQLKDMECTYLCFCNEEQLTFSRRIQKLSGNPQRYIGTCRSLSSETIEKKLSEGLRPAVRFRVPDNEEVTFIDFVRGKQKYHTNDIGDFIIHRANGISPFVFCNAIDDALMKVTHVLRGEDHLPNTPRQLLILQTLGLPIPVYGHTSLIIELGGIPLSKRYGSYSLKNLRETGYLPEAIINCLARLGNYYKSNELLSLFDLSKEFDVEYLNKSPATFDIKQLNYWQKKAVAQLSENRFWKWIMGSREVLQSKIPNGKFNVFLETIKPNVMFPQDVDYWATVCFDRNFPLTTIREKLQKTEKHYCEVALEGFKKFGRNLRSVIDYVQSLLILNEKILYRTLRLALTGAVYGPELSKLIILMDDRIVYKRLREVCR